MKPYNIALCGTYFMESVGDSLLFECVKFLYTSIAVEKKIIVKFRLVDLNGYENLEEWKRVSTGSNLQKIHRKLSKILRGNKYYTKSEDPIYYYKAFSNCDLVVVFGGGLFKYGVNRDYTKVFRCINETANRMKIPVVYNAIGVEGPHHKGTFEFESLKNAFENGVKIFSVRDRYDIAKSYFEDTNIDVRLVGDTGILANRTFNKKASDENWIGANPVACQHFKPYFPNANEKVIFNIWVDTLEKLLSEGNKVLLFTNGDSRDARFARKIFDFLSSKRLAIQMVNAKNASEMVDNISQCRLIIASRLHTCITAYSLSIPAIGLAWNDKLIYWGENIGAKSMFLDYNHFDKELIFQALKRIDDGFSYDKTIRSRLERSLYELASDAVDIMIKNARSK